MVKYFRIPSYFLLIGALVGVVLRWHFVSPIVGLHFQNWLHAHSHIMFLGWITNIIFLAIVYKWVRDTWPTVFRVLFIAMQVIIGGMVISFPLQGYGLYSITLLALHNILSYIFCTRFYVRTKHQTGNSIQFIRHSLTFFVISTAGAIAVGPIAATGYGQSQWYYFSIFFYLHFQYNGFFLFAALGLFLKQLEEKKILQSQQKITLFRKTLFVSCFPAYFLSVIWSEPGILVILVAAFGALLQLFSFGIFCAALKPMLSKISEVFSPFLHVLLITVFLSIYAKVLLQSLSSVPTLIDFISQVRFFVLAYLHLVLIGAITFYLIIWMRQEGLSKGGYFSSWVLVVAFVGSELSMVAAPLSGSWFSIITVILFVFSLLLLMGFALSVHSSSTAFD
jgi:hypothetical protein